MRIRTWSQINILIRNIHTISELKNREDDPRIHITQFFGNLSGEIPITVDKAVQISLKQANL